VCHRRLQDPFPDIDMNIKGTAVVMEAVRRRNPRAKVIYTGTRGQYGPSVKLPVSEDAPTNPKGIYEISNLTAEKIIQVYNDTHGIRSVMLRITNTYGPRAQMKHSRFGVANWFVRLAIDNDTIRIFGDGRILRDFLYVDDCVEAILISGAHEDAPGEIFNVGVDQPTTFLELAQALTGGRARALGVAPTPERQAQEPDFYSTSPRSGRCWAPRTPIREGLPDGGVYRKNKHFYWE
jgi:UDP-glucose 4-epimerase